jgi:hypothetical protein
MSKQPQTPEDLSSEELERIVADFVARDGPGPGDLPADTFFALWERFEAERREQVIELEQDIIGGEIVLSVAPPSPDVVQVERNEIQLGFDLEPKIAPLTALGQRPGAPQFDPQRAEQAIVEQAQVGCKFIPSASAKSAGSG